MELPNKDYKENLYLDNQKEILRLLEILVDKIINIEIQIYSSPLTFTEGKIRGQIKKKTPKPTLPPPPPKPRTSGSGYINPEKE